MLCTFGGCGSNGSNNAQVAKLRLVLADGGVFNNLGTTVTVSVDGKVTTFPNLTCSPNQACTLGYLTVPAGGFNFAVYQVFSSPGRTSVGTTNLVPSQFQTLNLSPNTQNTFVLVEGEVGYLFLDDKVVAAGSVKLRLANADVSPFAPAAAAAWVNPDGGTSGNPTISGVQLGSASSYVTLPPGQYIAAFGPNSTLPNLGPTTLAANQNVTVYVWCPDLLGPIDSAFVLTDN